MRYAIVSVQRRVTRERWRGAAMRMSVMRVMLRRAARRVTLELFIDDVRVRAFSRPYVCCREGCL